jgi:hypothetical protein
MAKASREVVSTFVVGSVSVEKYNDNKIEIKHELPPEPYDKALNIVGRAEVVLSITDFWESWDTQARKDFALALTYVAGEMIRTVPQLAELTPAPDNG